MQFLDLKGDKEKQKCWGEITAPSVRQMVDKPMIISPGVYVHFYFGPFLWLGCHLALPLPLKWTLLGECM